MNHSDPVPPTAGPDRFGERAMRNVVHFKDKR